MKNTLMNRLKLIIHCKLEGHVSINQILKKQGLGLEENIYCASCFFGRGLGIKLRRQKTP